MPTLTAAQAAKVAQSIRTQYSKSATYIPGKVAKARALRLVLSKPSSKSKAGRSAAKAAVRAKKVRNSRNPYGALSLNA